MNPTGGPDAPRVTWRRTAVAGVVIAAALVARSVVPRAPDAISRPATRSGGATSGDVDRPGVAPAPGAADRSSDAPAPAARSSRRRRPHAERRRERVDRRQRGDARAVFSTDPQTVFSTESQTTRDNVPGLDGASGTIALWLQPGWSANDPAGATLVQFGDDRLRLAKAGGVLRFELVDGLGARVTVEAPIVDWRPGEWHQVVATWDGRTIALYIDGAQVATAAEGAPPTLPPGTPLYVGSAAVPGQAVAPGVMSGVTIRDRALSAGAVAHRYDAGARR